MSLVLALKTQCERSCAPSFRNRFVDEIRWMVPVVGRTSSHANILPQSLLRTSGAACQPRFTCTVIVLCLCVNVIWQSLQACHFRRAWLLLYTFVFSHFITVYMCSCGVLCTDGDEQVSDSSRKCRHAWRIVCHCWCDTVYCQESSSLFPSSFQGIYLYCCP